MSTRRSERPEPRRVRYQRAAILLGAGMLTLAAGVARLQLLDHERYKDLAERNWLRLEVLRAPRGRIFDTSGVLLADNAPAFSVVFQPPPVGSARADTLAAAARDLLSSLLGLPDSTVRQVVRQSTRGGVPQAFRRDVPQRVLAGIEEHLSELPGVEIVIEPRRAYPESTRCAHVMGYAGEIGQIELDSLVDRGYRSGDLIGRAGLERSYERELRGEDGHKILVVNASGRRVRLFEEEKPVLPVAGHDLVLTLDVRLQRALEEAMGNIESGAAVAVDPRTGGVLALVSRPSFDPNEFARGLSRARWNELVNDPAHPLLDRAIQSAYPPGSTFKVVTSLAGLAEHAFTPDTRFASCGGGYFYGGRFYRCWEHKGHGSLTLLDALARSCDTYFYQAGLHLGLKRLTEWARKLRLGERTGIDLPQERGGLVPTPEWFAKVGRKPTGGAVLNIAIGQGELLVTPLQLAMLAATVASRGHTPKPHLVREIRDPMTGSVRRVEAEETHGIDPDDDDWNQVIAAMERVVAAGTGGRARVPDIRVAGKTGTAQNPHGQDHALFICFAPVDEPRVAIAVVAENAGHGGDIAAPVAGHALLMYLAGDRPQGPSFSATPRVTAVRAVPDSVDTAITAAD